MGEAARIRDEKLMGMRWSVGCSVALCLLGCSTPSSDSLLIGGFCFDRTLSWSPHLPSWSAAGLVVDARRVNREWIAAKKSERVSTAQLNLAVELAYIDRLDEAKWLLDRIIKIDPHNRWARYNRSMVMARQFLWRSAIADFKMYLDGGPSDSSDITLLVSLTALDSGMSAARKTIGDLAESQRIWGILALATVQLYQRDWLELDKTCAMLQECSAGSNDLMIRGRILGSLGRWFSGRREQALRDIGAVIKDLDVSTHSGYAWCLRAAMWRDMGRVGRFLRDIRASCKFGDLARAKVEGAMMWRAGDAPLYVAKAICIDDALLCDESVESLDRAVNMDPTLAEAYFWRAVSRDARGKHVDALADIARALSLGIEGEETLALRREVLQAISRSRAAGPRLR